MGVGRAGSQGKAASRVGVRAGNPGAAAGRFNLCAAGTASRAACLVPCFAPSPSSFAPPAASLPAPAAHLQPEADLRRHEPPGSRSQAVSRCAAISSHQAARTKLDAAVKPAGCEAHAHQRQGDQRWAADPWAWMQHGQQSGTRCCALSLHATPCTHPAAPSFACLMTSTATPSSPSPSMADSMGRPAVPPGSPSSLLRYCCPTCGHQACAKGRKGRSAFGSRSATPAPASVTAGTAGSTSTHLVCPAVVRSRGIACRCDERCRLVARGAGPGVRHEARLLHLCFADRRLRQRLKGAAAAQAGRGSMVGGTASSRCRLACAPHLLQLPSRHQQQHGTHPATAAAPPPSAAARAARHRRCWARLSAMAMALCWALSLCWAGGARCKPPRCSLQAGSQRRRRQGTALRRLQQRIIGHL